MKRYKKSKTLSRHATIATELPDDPIGLNGIFVGVPSSKPVEKRSMGAYVLSLFHPNARIHTEAKGRKKHKHRTKKYKRK